MLLRAGVRELSRSVLKPFHERLAGLASTLLAILIRSRGLEYRNTVRFLESASSEQMAPSRVERAAQLRGANLLFS